MITAELQKLNSELPGRTWRVSNVHYGQHMDISNFRGGKNQIMAMAMSETVGASMPQDYNEEDSDDDGVGSGGFDVSQKVTLSANVTISSTVNGFTSA